MTVMNAVQVDSCIADTWTDNLAPLNLTSKIRCEILCSLLHPRTGAEYCDQFVCLSVICLSASISLEWLDRSLRNLFRSSPVAVARSSSGGVALRYVLLVLWMTSRLPIVGRMAMRGRLTLKLTTTSGVVILGWSLMSVNALFTSVTFVYCCE